MYIGQHRFNKPMLDKKYKGSGRRLKLAYAKYGIENFSTKILEWVRNNEELNEREIYWIDALNTFKSEEHYNERSGGVGIGEYSKEMRRIRSERVRGELNPMYGKHHTPETIARLREISLNPSEEARQKMSIASLRYFNECGGRAEMSKRSKAYWNSTEGEARKQQQSIKMSGENNFFFGKHLNGELNPMYGKHLSEKQKKVISARQSRAVVQMSLDFKLIKVWNSIRQASINTKTNESQISECCRHRSYSSNGYRWEYQKFYESEDFNMTYVNNFFERERQRKIEHKLKISGANNPNSKIRKLKIQEN